MKTPKILFYDIETSPNLAYVWGKWEQNVLAYKEQWQILSVAYKFKGDKDVKIITNRKHNDKALVAKLRELFLQSDIIVAHNGDAFDFKKVTARMVYHNMKPINKVPSVDTKKVAKSHFEFNGNSLNDLGTYFKLGQKLKHTGFELWLGCLANKEADWKLMIEYNKQDVVLLEKLYERLLPWMSNHPSIAKITEPSLVSLNKCPICASKGTKKKGLHVLRKTVYQRRQCKNCWHMFITRYIAS